MSYLGDLLKRLRADQSLHEIECAVGIERSILSKYERGLRIPQKPKLLILARYFKVSYKELRKASLSDIFNDQEERAIVIEWAKEISD